MIEQVEPPSAVHGLVLRPVPDVALVALVGEKGEGSPGTRHGEHVAVAPLGTLQPGPGIGGSLIGEAASLGHRVQVFEKRIKIARRGRQRSDERLAHERDAGQRFGGMVEQRREGSGVEQRPALARRGHELLEVVGRITE